MKAYKMTGNVEGIRTTVTVSAVNTAGALLIAQLIKLNNVVVTKEIS